MYKCPMPPPKIKKSVLKTLPRENPVLVPPPKTKKSTKTPKTIKNRGRDIPFLGIKHPMSPPKIKKCLIFNNSQKIIPLEAKLLHKSHFGKKKKVVF